MAKYSQIQAWVKQHYDFVPKSCWIAHVKSDCGLPTRIAPNRRDPTYRAVPCPPDKRPGILAAFKHFGMIRAAK